MATQSLVSPYQFTIRSVLAFSAKCGCLLSFLLLSGDTLGAVIALPVFGIWMPFELAISQAREPPLPTAVSTIFLLGRMLFVYGACLVAIAATLIARSFSWTRPWSLSQTIVVTFGVTMLFGCAALLSLVSCILSAVSWRWDRRARWFAYFNAGYLATMAAVMGMMSFL